MMGGGGLKDTPAPTQNIEGTHTPSPLLPKPMRFNILVLRESFKVRKFCKNRCQFDPYFTLITVTFLKVLFIDNSLFRIENMKIDAQNCAEHQIFGIFAPKTSSPL